MCSKLLFLPLVGLVSANPLSSNSPFTAESILDKATRALGGQDAIDSLQGVTYHAPNIFRSRSLMQSYNLNQADTAVAVSGHQNVSFSFSSNEVQQRIDRYFTPSDYWVWSSPSLEPFNFSLVVSGGDDGFACYVNGNNQIWLPSNLTSGYTDPALAEYLVLQGDMVSPKLTSKVRSHQNISSIMVDINGVEMPAVHDPALELTMIFDAETYLPYIIRTIEDHSIYGKCTHDLYLTSYKPYKGIMFPGRIQNIFNSTTQLLNAPIEDYLIGSVSVNPHFPSDFFKGIPESQSMFPKSAPKKVKGVSHARITEFSSNMLWAGVTKSTVEGIKFEQPIHGLPKVHWLLLDDAELGVKQMVLEFENGVIVCDAPPQWTTSVIEWIKINLKKPVTHLWPTHHHRDHSGGANEYVATGAKLIVPEVAVNYWSSIPNATFVTFNETHPYVHKDADMQVWFTWQHQATHAVDWSYAFITPACPTDRSPVAVLEADAWQAGLPAEQSDQAIMRRWLDQLMRDGVTSNANVIPTHGQVTPLSELINITGYPYPHISATSWKGGVARCD